MKLYYKHPKFVYKLTILAYYFDTMNYNNNGISSCICMITGIYNNTMKSHVDSWSVIAKNLSQTICHSHGRVTNQTGITRYTHQDLDIFPRLYAASTDKQMPWLLPPLPQGIVMLPPFESHCDTAL